MKPQETPSQHQVSPVPVEPINPSEAEQASSGWRLNRTATIAATVLLSVLTNTPRLQDFEVGDSGRQTASEQVVPLQGTDPASAEATGEASLAKTFHEDKVEIATEKWAKLFSSDREAGKLTAVKELTKVSDRIDKITGDGYRITSISLEGHASAEDDSVDSNGQRTAGLREPSQANRKLADKRARTFRTLLLGETSERDQEIPNLVDLPPVEDILDKSEVEHIDGLAKQFGYSQVVTMIEDYNRGGKVPEAVEKYLDEVLAKERKVVVTIDAVKDTVTPVTADAGFDIPGTTGEGKSTTDTDLTDTLVVTLPLFLFVPIGRRRREGSTETQEGQAPWHRAFVPRRGDTLIEVTRPLVRPTLAFAGRVAKDAAFDGKLRLPAGHTRVARSQKQPRPLSMHGHKGRNSHHVRDRGGSRPGVRR